MSKRASLLLVLAVVLCLGFSAVAQTSDVYGVNYYTNTTAPLDNFIYIVNPGVQGAPINPATGLVSTAGYLCANLYVFDNRQEMLECCSCPISPNGLITLSLKKNLLANPLTAVVPNSGVIKLVSSLPISVTPNGVSPTTATAVCDAGEIGSAGETILPDLRAWATQTQIPASGTYVTTQSVFADAPLSAAEGAFLPLACQMVRYLGSGQGVCTCSTGS